MHPACLAQPRSLVGDVVMVVAMMMMPLRESGSGAEDQDGEDEKLFHVLILARVGLNSA
jgi:hypothetical protein